MANSAKGLPGPSSTDIAKANAEKARVAMNDERLAMDLYWTDQLAKEPALFQTSFGSAKDKLDIEVDALNTAWNSIVNVQVPPFPPTKSFFITAHAVHVAKRAEIQKWMADLTILIETMKTVRHMQKLPVIIASGGVLLPNGVLIGGGVGGNGIGGGSIGGTGHGFGGGGGPNSTDFHGIPGVDFGDDEGAFPNVPGSRGGGDFRDGFFGVGSLHPGIGDGGGKKKPGPSPGKGKTKTGGTGGSYVDANTKNDARGSEKGGGGDTPSGGGGGSTDKDGEAGATDGIGITDDTLQFLDYDTGEPIGGSQPIDGGGGDTGGNASESRRTFTGFHPQSSGPAGGVSIGGGAHHLPGSPISYITATSDVGSGGGITEGFGGTNPNVRVYRPDPEVSGGGSGPRNPFFRPSDETGSPRGPGARVARQVTVASTSVRTRLR